MCEVGRSLLIAATTSHSVSHTFPLTLLSVTLFLSTLTPSPTSSHSLFHSPVVVTVALHQTTAPS